MSEEITPADAEVTGGNLSLREALTCCMTYLLFVSDAENIERQDEDKRQLMLSMTCMNIAGILAEIVKTADTGSVDLQSVLCTGPMLGSAETEAQLIGSHTWYMGVCEENGIADEIRAKRAQGKTDTPPTTGEKPTLH